MIKKLRTKFILLTMSSLFVLLFVLVGSMNLVNYRAVVKESDGILVFLSQNKGRFPSPEDEKGEPPLPPQMSPELPHETRYFSVLMSTDGRILHTETSKITAVNTATAISYAESACARQTENGFIGRFRFVRFTEINGIRYTFLDCGRSLDAFRSFMYASIGIALLGLVIVFFVVFFVAGRIIRPFAENYEKQKRFITDAGHEIKTPLTIINANVDVLEMELGQNECLDDIQLQTKRLTSLTNDLVLLARMEESSTSMPMIEFPISEVIAEAVLPFRTLAQAQEKNVQADVQPMLSAVGNGKAIQQLISVLMDNAVKYTPRGGTITVHFARQGKVLCLLVHNTTETEIDTESLSHVFDRFYRMDASRSSSSGGHGIGLSVAKAIVTAHNGKIQASTTDRHSFLITITLPG